MPTVARRATNRPLATAGGSALKVCVRRSSDAPVSTGQIVGLPQKSCSRHEPGLLTLSDSRLGTTAAKQKWVDSIILPMLGRREGSAATEFTHAQRKTVPGGFSLTC